MAFDWKHGNHVVNSIVIRRTVFLFVILKAHFHMSSLSQHMKVGGFIGVSCRLCMLFPDNGQVLCAPSRSIHR